jgi:hypothetical protein
MNEHNPDSRPIETIAGAFQKFAQHCHGESPLYERLAQGIEEDRFLLELAAHARPGQPVGNMLFAAVQYLLLEQADHPLAACYPALAGASAPPDDPLPAFRDFCRRHQQQILELIRTQRTQTNEVRRCAYLLPAFTCASRLFGGRPLALLEIGASAGLNLRWDRYRYDYNTGMEYGMPGAQPRIDSSIRGELQPPLPKRLPEVRQRQGIDLHPVDLRQPEARRWLRALIWPEHLERAQLLQQAMAATCADPPPLIAGDALELLPALGSSISQESLLCVYHTHVIYQFTPEQRELLRQQIAVIGAQRDLCYFATEGIGTANPRLELQVFRNGQADQRLLAHCHHHGRWLQWVDIESAEASATIDA